MNKALKSIGILAGLLAVGLGALLVYVYQALPYDDYPVFEPDNSAESVARGRYVFCNETTRKAEFLIKYFATSTFGSRHYRAGVMAPVPNRMAIHANCNVVGQVAPALNGLGTIVAFESRIVIVRKCKV